MAELDAETMAKLYSDDVVFEDPAFGQLKGERVRNMWRMLLASQKKETFRVAVSDVVISDERASCRIEATYLFTRTGRRVINRITASFILKDGKIVAHTDDFNLHRWSSKALGIKGYLFGWTPFFRRKLQAQTNRMLDRFKSGQ